MHSFVIELARSCNENCIHCYMDPLERKNGNLFFDDTDLYEKILIDLVNHEFIFLTLTGGGLCRMTVIWIIV